MSAAPPTVARHGAWASPITADFILSAFVAFAELRYRDGAFYWLEARPNEGGRSALVCLRDGERRDLTPAPLNARSRVHEYGGGAFAVSDTTAWFVNFEDQNIHAVPLNGSVATRVTLSDADERFGALIWDERRASLIAVRERHGVGDEASNDLVRVDVVDGAIEVLHSGHDFYAGASLSPSGDKLAFLVWDHPNMPWDGTQLIVATLDAAGAVGEATVVAGGAAESICQPEWMHDHRLAYVSDASGFWNLHCYDESGAYCAAPDEAEYGVPLWSLDARSYVPVGPRHVVAQRIEAGVAELVVADLDQGPHVAARRGVLKLPQPRPHPRRRRVHRRQKRRCGRRVGTGHRGRRTHALGRGGARRFAGRGVVRAAVHSLSERRRRRRARQLLSAAQRRLHGAGR